MSIEDAKDLGAMMNKARKGAGLDLCDIAKEICVSKSYLTAIEEGDFERLPAFPFAIGFVKSFASEIKLDAVEVAMQFKAIVQPVEDEEILDESAAPEKDIKKLFTEDEEHKKKGALYGGVAVMMSALSAVYMVFVGGAQQATYVEDSSPSQTVQLADASKAVPTSTVTGATEPRINVSLEEEDFAPAGNQFMGVANADDEGELVANLQAAEVMLEARQDAWLRVSSQDTVLFEGILRAGDHFVPPMGPELNLTTSNAGALALRIGEHDLGVLGSKGAIIENVKIDPDSLILKLVETL